MKILNKNTDYAVRALLVMAMRGDDYISARDIAKAQKIPYQFLRRILQTLIKEKMAEAKEGGKGGVRLLADPKKITLIDIIEIFQGDVQISECMFRKKICHNRSQCVLRHRITKIEEKVVGEFRGITLQSLVDDLNK